VSLKVMGSDAICKYLSWLSLILCQRMRPFVVSICHTALWTPGA